MERRFRITRLSAVALVVLVLALFAVVLGPTRGVQVAGLVVVIAELLMMATRPVLGPAIDNVGRFSTFGRRVPGPDDGSDPEPDYIAQAGTPSEAAWKRERELYRDKRSAEGAGSPTGDLSGRGD